MATTVLAAFNQLLARQNLTDRQRETARDRVQALKDFFTRNFTMASSPFPMGSYARGTMCAGERDIDILAPLAFEYWERYKADSSRFLYAVRDALNTQYARTDVSSRRMAVTLDFTDIVTDVVPAFRRKGGGFLIPDGNGGWKPTNPPFHTQSINDADQTKGGRLKSLIRLMKAWNIANGHLLASFHVELMVNTMWTKATTIPEWPTAMASTLKASISWVKVEFKDPWPDGSRISGYLSQENLTKVLGWLESDAADAANAQKLASAGYVQRAFEYWASIYRQKFPAYA